MLRAYLRSTPLHTSHEHGDTGGTEDATDPVDFPQNLLFRPDRSESDRVFIADEQEYQADCIPRSYQSTDVTPNACLRN